MAKAQKIERLKTRLQTLEGDIVELITEFVEVR